MKHETIDTVLRIVGLILVGSGLGAWNTSASVGLLLVGACLLSLGTFVGDNNGNGERE